MKIELEIDNDKEIQTLIDFLNKKNIKFKLQEKQECLIKFWEQKSPELVEKLESYVNLILSGTEYQPTIQKTMDLYKDATNAINNGDWFAVQLIVNRLIGIHSKQIAMRKSHETMRLQDKLISQHCDYVTEEELASFFEINLQRMKNILSQLKYEPNVINKKKYYNYKIVDTLIKIL